DLRAAEHCGVADGFSDATTEVCLTAGEGTDAALATGPVAGRKVEQRLREIVLLQPLSDRLGRFGIGPEIFDTGEAVAGRSIEAIEKCEFRIEHRKIGGETKHWWAWRSRGRSDLVLVAGHADAVHHPLVARIRNRNGRDQHL